MTKRLININSKSPIIIEESRNIIFFPLKSIREKSNIWISYNNLEKYVKILVYRENRSMNSYTGITKIKLYDNISDPTKINSDNYGFYDY